MEITMAQIYGKLDEFHQQLECLKKNVTMNYATVFLGSPCDANCKHYEACSKMIQPLRKEYQRFLKEGS